MLKTYIIITNNQDVHTALKEKYDVQFIESPDQMGVLEEVRRLVHSGYLLETHPLSGSIKPNETPYKSVILSKPASDQTDVQSLTIIEDSISTFLKFQKNRPILKWTEHVLQDFRDIDTSLMMSNIGKMI